MSQTHLSKDDQVKKARRKRYVEQPQPSQQTFATGTFSQAAAGSNVLSRRPSALLNRGPSSLLQRQASSRSGSTTGFLQLRLRGWNFAQLAGQATDQPVLQPKLQANPVEDRSEQQTKRNQTGLPDKLKSGIEHLSGLSLDDVKLKTNGRRDIVQRRVFKTGEGVHEKWWSTKLPDQDFKSEAEALAAEKARLNPAGLGMIGARKARLKHWINKKIKGDKFDTLKQHQDAAMNQGQREKQQGTLRYGKHAISAITMTLKAGTSAVGTAIGGPLGTAVALGINLAIDKVKAIATAGLKDELEKRAAQAHVLLESEAHEEMVEHSVPAAGGQGYVDEPEEEGLPIKDQAERDALIKMIKKLGGELKKKTEEEIKEQLNPQEVSPDLFLKGSVEEIAASLLWEGIKLSLSQVKKKAESGLDEANAGAKQTAYHRFV